MYVWTILLLAFVSELLMLAALGYAIWRLAGGGVWGWIGAGLAVGVACVLWGLFAAPKATFDVGAVQWVVKIGLFAAAVALLVTVGARAWVWVGFAVFSVVVNVLALLPPVAGRDL
ncbi:YrdB family protein [Tsukamurella sp. 8F]|uniref:YrdB family protein n=1 Tax=unclassified Tsukamurella TaxID=2633480 RepID=UPI0023B8D962|nr:MULTISPECIES: YrdB family protein [unclassified Tsukamurella]MDF0531028.1 YrdB family protein [Tsukamurella sp. 8J]MDF0589271.1 YrdB family protein [Tsukamurella sp. 8F]